MNLIETIVWRVCMEIPVGRAACKRVPTNLAMQRIAEQGNGDHLEIGCLFGATLIMAALVKEAFHFDGMVYGIDPLDGYYPPSPIHPDPVYDRKLGIKHSYLDTHTNAPVNMDSIMANIRHFGVEHRIKVIQAFSQPLPSEASGREYASAYIDGDHWGEAPTLDWLSVFPLIRKGGVVIFDDHVEFEAVHRATVTAMSTKGWTKLDENPRHFYVVRKA